MALRLGGSETLVSYLYQLWYGSELTRFPFSLLGFLLIVDGVTRLCPLSVHLLWDCISGS